MGPPAYDRLVSCHACITACLNWLPALGYAPMRRGFHATAFAPPSAFRSGQYPKVNVWCALFHGLTARQGIVVVFGGNSLGRPIGSLTCLDLHRWEWFTPSCSGTQPSGYISVCHTLLRPSAYSQKQSYNVCHWPLSLCRGWRYAFACFHRRCLFIRHSGSKRRGHSKGRYAFGLRLCPQ